MNPSMDDRHILAEMERHLAREDPELASLMDTLNHQFPDSSDEGRGGNKAQHDWHGKLAIVFALVAVVGMILTAIFSRQAPPDDNNGPPNGITPAHSVHVQRRTAAGTPMRRRRTTPTATARPADPPYGPGRIFALVPDTDGGASSRTPRPRDGGPSENSSADAVASVVHGVIADHQTAAGAIGASYADCPERAPPLRWPSAGPTSTKTAS
ncbi:DUF3040 domain-containing protein [Streptomyces sp. NPDC006368]|uniref:DUF3040 domain-containing protein n=1 Tax=Streptomyces sp. NPDC006368 TaxID=3156760 RepID=UPI0033ACA46E